MLAICVRGDREARGHLQSLPEQVAQTRRFATHQGYALRGALGKPHDVRIARHMGHGKRSPQRQSRSEASRAPSASARNLAHTTFGLTSGENVAFDEKPQSAPAITRSRPTSPA